MKVAWPISLATVFALVQLDTAPPPTTHGEIGTEIIAGNANVFGALLPGQGAGTNTLMVTGLTVNTGYTAYLAAIDANNINTDTIEQIDFRTSPPRLEGDGATAFLRSTVDRESSPAFLLDARTSGQIGRASGLINSCDVVAETSGGTVRELPAGLSVVVSTDGHGCVVVGTSQVFTQPTTEYFIAATDSEGLVSEPASLRIKLIESNAPDFRTAITEGLLERGFDYSGANAIRIVNIGSAPNADDAEPRGCVQTTAIGQLTVRRSDDGETCIIEGSFADDYDGNSVSVNILASTNSHVIDEVLTENARVTFGFIDTQTAAPVVSSDYGEHRLRSFLFDVDYSSVAPAVGTGPNPVHYSVPFLGPQSGKVGFCRLALGSPALPFGLNLVPSPDGARCVVTVIGEGNLSPTVYTIIASNSVGSSTPSTLRIEVADEFFEPPSLSLADQTFVLNTTISPAVATANAGSKLSTTLRDACQLTNSSNDLPAGLMITLAEDGNSCEISGTPATLTAPEGVDISISYPTDIANNASATLEFNIKVINAPSPSNPIERTYFTTNQEYNNEPSSNANSRAAVAGDSAAGDAVAEGSNAGGAVAGDSNAGGAVAGDSNAGGAVAGDSSAPLRDRRAVVTSSSGGATPRPSNSRGAGYFAIGQAYGDGLSGNADAGDSNARGSSAPLRDRRAVVTSSSGGAAPRLIGPADTAYFAIGQAYGDGLGGNTGKLDSPVQFRDRRAADTYSSGWVQRCELASVNGQTPSTTDPSRRLPEGLSLVVTHNKDGCAVVGKASEYTATRVYTFKAFDINNNVHTPVSARIRVVTGFKPNIEWQDETTSGIFFEDNANYTGASALRLRNIGAPPTANGCTLTATNPQTNTIVATGLSATRSHDGETCQIEGLYTANTAEKNIVLTLSITSAPEADAQTEQYRYAGALGSEDQLAQYGYAGTRGADDQPAQYGYAGALGAGTQTEVYVYSVRSMGEGFSKQTSPVVVSDRYGQDRLRSASVGVGLAQNGSDNIAVHFADPGGGEIAFCRLSEESPPLPAGLAVTIASNRRSCAVQGTPTQVSAPAIYTIIALNSANVDRRLAIAESVGVGTSTADGVGVGVGRSTADGMGVGVGVGRSTADGVGVGVGSAGSENADEGSADDGSGGGGPAVGSLRLEVLATDEVYASGTYRMPSLSLADQTLTVGAAISPAIAFTNSGAKLSTTLREACRLTAASAALLPAGLEITLAKDGSTCEISGTATTATAPEGIELSVEYPTDLTNANGLTIFTLIVNPGS
ncbi:MAG: hypothetical protein K0U66_03565 [Gammaproteobacteria bacterium]|nr:hypothetical protein [Gammaproteobacteria bacterium]